ncbi:hypothetical protein A2709_03450 [candidate division WWE3 bacterium RIFCSPHIGHO2_01_FULL_43_9]|uniref:Uncharacterized protein n=1 Tax=candidate division WWE3 bacterium RIFCSPHIGHO2_01_FULL_43_9 TaxID=1802618 RepID=A0A1F4V920_UNCKA|nr:MAG: hypothetical protein A2709_03450 [candidate division WWE3 bacterium RIFCSPHIGHO2_01_FULL_43_9]
MISLKKDESTIINLQKGKLDIYLGSKNNHVVIAKLALWYNFKDKIKSVTERYYVYDPRSFSPAKPVSRARKIIGNGEKIILGLIRNQLYFSETGSWDKKLSPEHLQIELKEHSLILTCLSQNNIEFQIKR